jgi:hypothetical protein
METTSLIPVINGYVEDLQQRYRVLSRKKQFKIAAIIAAEGREIDDFLKNHGTFLSVTIAGDEIIETHHSAG